MVTSTGCPIKKVSIKKLLFGAAQGLSLQILNLFGFSISVSSVLFGVSFKEFGRIYVKL